MVGAAASALANLRPGAPGAPGAPGTSTSQAAGNRPTAPASLHSQHPPSASAAPTGGPVARYPPLFSQRADIHSPANSTTDSQAESPSDDEYDGETQHADGGAAADMAHGGNGRSHGQTATGAANSVGISEAQGTQPGAGSGAGGSNSLDVKKPRACEACRGLKVRCDMDPNALGDTPCRRCAKSGRRCVVTQPTRRRQKKTDSRVAELEKKIDALTASLQLTRHAGVPAKDDEAGSSGRPTTQSQPPTGAGFLRNWPPIIDSHPAPSAAPPPAATSSAPAANKDRPPSSSTAASTGPAPAPASHSPYSASSVARNAFSSVPPPMVMAGQKRKFSEIREATGVVGAGAGGGGPGSRASLGSRAGSAIGDESPSVRENPYGYHTHHGHGHHPSQQRHHAQDGRQPQSQQSPSFSMSPSPALAGNSTRFGTEYADIIDRGLLTMDKAVELFQRYTDNMARHMPAVVFPPGTTAAEIRKSKPVLFISIMAAATTEMPDVQRAIVKEMMQVFAEKVFITGEKSLEIVQALQVAVIWYWPPEHFEELKFYQLVHTAAVMAIDIGLGKRRPGNKTGPAGTVAGAGGSLLRGGPWCSSNAPGARNGNGNGGRPFTNWRDHPFKKYPLPDPCSIEGRRAWLACYFMTSNTAMALHRPTLIRWTSFMTECVEILENSPDAAPTDKYFCHLVWTHRLAEEVGQQFSMDDPSTVINIADPRTQYALRGFERELERYKATIPRNLLQPSLRLSFEVVSLYMHEIALQTENGNDDFKAPYTAESTKEALIGDATLTPAHIRALTTCLLAIDGIFDAFLGMDIAALRCIPVFNFVRVAYATVVMIKLYLFASSPNSELGKVINKEHMKVEQHLNALLDKFRATSAGNKSRPAGKFMIVLAMVRSWFLKQQAFENREGREQEAGDGQQSSESSQAQAQAQPHYPASSTSGPLGATPNNSSASAQPYFPSSGLLSTISINNGNIANSTQAPATSSTAATPTLSAASSASYTTPGTGHGQAPLQPPLQQLQQQRPHHQHPHQQHSQMQPSATMYPTANTPLQLLSEIAANDYAATAATTAAAASASVSMASQQQQPQQAQQQPIPPWPPFYASMPNSGSQPSGGSTTETQQQQQQQQSNPADPLMQPPPQAVTTSDYMAMYPHLNLGDNFEYAMDLTFGGLSEGAGDLNLSDGLQYLLADPWFGGVPGEAFQL